MKLGAELDYDLLVPNDLGADEEVPYAVEIFDAATRTGKELQDMILAMPTEAAVIGSVSLGSLFMYGILPRRSGEDPIGSAVETVCRALEDLGGRVVVSPCLHTELAGVLLAVSGA